MNVFKCSLTGKSILFSIIAFSSVSPSPVSFSIFSVSFGPPVISHSSITRLRSSSFLLHSLHLSSPSSFQYYLALISFPHLNLANIFLSFHFILPSKCRANKYSESVYRISITISVSTAVSRKLITNITKRVTLAINFVFYILKYL